MTRRISQRGIAHIKSRESFRARRYFCPAGVLSIGYGHSIRPHEEFPEPMTEAEATALIERDLAPIEIYLTAVLPNIPQHQFDALTSLIYNIGLGAFDHSTLLRLARAGDVAGAGEEFKKWIYSNKVVLAGLVARRAAERAMYLGQLETEASQ